MQKILHFEKNIALLLKVICFFQIIILIWFNVFQLKYHIGYDTSAYFDAAIEMWNQKSFLLKNYEYQTSLYLDSPVPLAAIFYGFTHNIFLSYGLSNLCCLCVILILLKDITQRLNFKPWCQWLTLLLVLCPYLPLIYGNANSLEYFNVLYVDFAAYSVKLVFFLLFLRVAISFSIYEKIFQFKSGNSFYYLCVHL